MMPMTEPTLQPRLFSAGLLLSNHTLNCDVKVASIQLQKLRVNT